MSVAAKPATATAASPEITVAPSFLATVFTSMGLGAKSPLWDIVVPPKTVTEAFASGAADAAASRVVDKLTRLTLHRWISKIPMFGEDLANIPNVNRVLNCLVALGIYLAYAVQDGYCQRQIDAGAKEVHRPLPFALYAFALMVLRREGGSLADSLMGWALRIWSQARTEIKAEHGADPLSSVAGLGMESK